MNQRTEKNRHKQPWLEADKLKTKELFSLRFLSDTTGKQRNEIKNLQNRYI